MKNNITICIFDMWNSEMYGRFKLTNPMKFVSWKGVGQRNQVDIECTQIYARAEKNTFTLIYVILMCHAIFFIVLKKMKVDLPTLEAHKFQLLPSHSYAQTSQSIELK